MRPNRTIARVALASLGFAGIGAVAAAPASAVPSAPECLTASASTTRTVALDWNDVPGATSYEVREDLYSPDHTVATVTASNRTSGALTSGTYRYYVIAKDASGSSLAGPKVTITANGTAASAASPAGCDPNSTGTPVETEAPVLTGSINASKQAVLDWNDIPGATAYKVYEPNGTPSGPVATVTTSNRTSGTLPNGVYDYSVTAVVNGVESPRSNVVHLVVGTTTPPPATAPVASYTQTATSGTAPLTVNFKDTSTNSPTSWAWDFGDGAVSSAQNPSHTYAAAGDYTISLQATNSAGSDIAQSSLVVRAPAPSGTLERSPYPLTNPITKNVPTTGGVVSLSSGQDYIVKFPAGVDVTHGVQITGGDDIQVIGGAVASPGEMALRVQNFTGNLYLEGLDLGGKRNPASSADYAIEGIQVAAPESNGITIQNVRVRNLHGTEAGDHADIFQFYKGGAGTKVYINRLDGITDFQGIMFQPDNVAPGVVSDLWWMNKTVLRRGPSGSTSGVLLNASNKSDNTPRQWSDVVLVTNKSCLSEVATGNDSSTLAAMRATPGYSCLPLGSSSIPNVLVGTVGSNYTSPGYIQ